MRPRKSKRPRKKVPSFFAAAVASSSRSSAGAVVVVVTSGASKTLTWQNTSTTATSYIVERSLNGTTWATIATLASTATTYTDTGLAYNTGYYYRVSAVNSTGTSMALTSGITYTAPELAVTAPSMTAINNNSVSVDAAELLVAPIGGYLVEYYRTGQTAWGQEVVVAALPVTLSGFVFGTLVYARITPFNVNANESRSLGPVSATVSATTTSALGWEPERAIATTGDSIVSTIGIKIEAKDLGSVTNHTINGVVFDAETVRSPFTGSYADTTVYTSGGIGAAFESVMDALNYGGTPGTMVLPGLITGETYLAQFFGVDAGAIINLGAYTSAATTGPYAITCLFVASGTTQNVTLTLGSLCAFQVRKIS